MNDLTMVGTPAASVPSFRGTGVAAVVRCAVAPVPPLKGTGLPVGGPASLKLARTRLPFAGIATHLGAVGSYGVVMGADQVQATAVRITADADQGIPPRRTPSRC